MRDFLLATLVLLAAAPVGAQAAVPETTCLGCETLRDFGNYGAAQLFRATGAFAPAVGNDRVWVRNPNTGRGALVDVDTPYSLFSFMGSSIPVPDITRTEINATWDDGSASSIWVLPNEVVAALAGSIESAESNETSEVTPEEVAELPGFGTEIGTELVWRFLGSWGGLSSGDLIFDLWRYNVDYLAFGTPVVTVIECAWTSEC